VVEQFLRLKLTLFANTFRRGPFIAFSLAFVLLYGAVLFVIAVSAVANLRHTTPEVAGSTLVVFGSVVLAGFLLIPLGWNADDALDPRRFSFLFISRFRLALLLLTAGAISIPVMMLIGMAIAQVVAWSGAAGSAFIAAASGIIVIATAVVGSRLASLIASRYLSTRRLREGFGILALTLVAASLPLTVLVALSDYQSQVLPALRRIAAVLEWTPLGVAFSAPASGAAGDTDEAAAKLAIAFGFLLALAACWFFMLSYVLSRPERSAIETYRSGLGWFRLMPATALGAIAARSLSYWARDARYFVALAAIPIIPLGMVAALMVGGISVDIIAWIPVPVMCLFLGWSAHNDVAHDNTALWTHVSAHTRGSDDRWGRIVPGLLVGIPLAIGGSILTVVVAGRPEVLPALIGLSLCLLFAGLGVSSISSAAAPYEAPLPGHGAFVQPQAFVSNAARVQAFTFALTLLCGAPVLAVVFFNPFVELDPHWAAFLVGLSLGLFVLVIGVYGGGRIMVRRGPELLALSSRN
jgi:ABC-2 type transport system permease protein